MENEPIVLSNTIPPGAIAGLDFDILMGERVADCSCAPNNALRRSAWKALTGK